MEDTTATPQLDGFVTTVDATEKSISPFSHDT